MDRNVVRIKVDPERYFRAFQQPRPAPIGERLREAGAEAAVALKAGFDRAFSGLRR